MRLICCAALLFALLSSCAAADDEKCVEGHSYHKDCNTCTCTSSGIYVCTLRACYDGPQFPDTPAITESTSICTPGESRMEDCNNCKCTADGLVWACTRMACPPKIPINDPGYTCTAGAVFKEECNTCTCDSSGTLARCTTMACDPNERHKRSEPNEDATDDHTEKKVCEPGTSWMEDCNRCRCSKSGTNVACTRMRCWPEDEKKHEENVKTKRQTHEREEGRHSDAVTSTTVAPETAQGGEAEKHSGTVKTTTEIAQPSNTACDPNTPATAVTKNMQPVVKVKCVNSDSNSVTATKAPTKKYRKTNNTRTETITTTTATTETYHLDTTTLKAHTKDEEKFTEAEYRSPEFKCTPSQSFKVDCNTCWCAVNGSTARYCTRIACKPKTYPPLESQ